MHLATPSLLLHLVFVGPELGVSLITTLLGLLFVLVILVVVSWLRYGEEIARLYIPDEDEVQGEGAEWLTEMQVHPFEQAKKKPSVFDASSRKGPKKKES
jgi:hypothetical protein